MVVHAVLSDMIYHGRIPTKSGDGGQYHYQQSHLLGLRTALGICVAAHLHRNLISNRVWDFVPGSQTKTEEAINAPCSRVHITTMLCSTYIHGDRCALRLKTLTEHFRDENFGFGNFELEFEF